VGRFVHGAVIYLLELFVSDYGLRIVNASDTCVAWHLSMWDGTG